MTLTEQSFQEFVDAIQTADDDAAFERVAQRLSQRLGFRWFAYLSFDENGSRLISSYPKEWTRHYFAQRYERIDPVLARTRRELALFQWNADGPRPGISREQSRFFDEAAVFGIKAGLTIPIRGGFNRFAAFTLASEERNEAMDRRIFDAADLFQLLGLYFHAHVAAKLVDKGELSRSPTLSQRERQCLAWAARGKTNGEIAAILGISTRTVVFHIENSRRKLHAVSLSHAVALALRSGMVP